MITIKLNNMRKLLLLIGLFLSIQVHAQDSVFSLDSLKNVKANVLENFKENSVDITSMCPDQSHRPRAAKEWSASDLSGYLWNFIFGDYYRGQDSKGKIEVEIAAFDEEGDLITFQDVTLKEYLPFQATFNSSNNTLKFEPQFIMQAGDYYIFQEPFKYDDTTDNLYLLSSISSKYDADRETLSFSPNQGIAWMVYFDKYQEDLFGFYDIFDFISASRDITESIDDDFTYQGITYTKLDRNAKTCKTKDAVSEGHWFRNKIEGEGEIPSKVKSGTTVYTVVEIGNGSFMDCNTLTSIKLPETITKIGSSAFQGCYNLKSVAFPNSLKEIGSSAFQRCSQLQSINLPNSVTTINGHAFENCKQLEKVTLSQSLKSIGNQAFSDCIALKEIAIPASLSSVGNHAFAGCTSLKNVNIPGSISEWGVYTFASCSSLESATFSTGIVSLPEYIFNDCQNLKNCKLPSSISTIGNYAFYNCKSLTFNSGLPSSIKEIGDYAFYHCTALKSDIIPGNIVKIGGFAFTGCTGLTSVSFPTTLSEIGKCAFLGCLNIEKVDVADLSKWCFVDLWDVDSNPLRNPKARLYVNGSKIGPDLIIPDDVHWIRPCTFVNCKDVKRIKIPETTTKIGGQAFAEIFSLQHVYSFAKKHPECDWTKILTDELYYRYIGVFDGLHNNNLVLHIPYGSSLDYLDDPQWAAFSRKFQDVESFYENSNDGIDNINLDDEEIVTIYNLGGIMIRNKISVHEMKQLPSGYYIVQCKKGTIKLKI